MKVNYESRSKSFRYQALQSQLYLIAFISYISSFLCINSGITFKTACLIITAYTYEGLLTCVILI
jgi:hypothetical protein